MLSNYILRSLKPLYMGDLFHGGSSATQSTTNNQIGQQTGAGAAAAIAPSGQGSAVAAQGSTAVSGQGYSTNAGDGSIALSGAGNKTINIVSTATDFGAVAGGVALAQKSLETAQAMNNLVVQFAGATNLEALHTVSNVVTATQAGDVSRARAAFDLSQSTTESALAFAKSGTASISSSFDKLVELSSHQTGEVIDANSDIALKSMQYANQTANKALEALHDTQQYSSGLISGAVNAAQQTALQAAPVSPGNYAESIQGQNTDLSKLAIIAGALIFIAVLVKRNS